MIATSTSYCPFSYQLEPEQPQACRFGFNGMEKDPEITGQEGSHYTAAFWEYDTRIGRRRNVDPVDKPWESSYATFGNNPIFYVDPNSDDWFQNEKTGAVYYHADYREGDEGKIEGEGCVHLGENGIFDPNDGLMQDGQLRVIEIDTHTTESPNIGGKDCFRSRKIEDHPTQKDKERYKNIESHEINN
ncbi:MAG: hypothetical protein PF448_12125 [Bacteroidales bacterium]|jgi:hypothetical protein|nr:hypothetical protein [Bacteroidales bacterium]